MCPGLTFCKIILRFGVVLAPLVGKSKECYVKANSLDSFANDQIASQPSYRFSDNRLLIDLCGEYIKT